VDTHLHLQVQPKGGSGKLGPFDFTMSFAAIPRPVLLGVVGVVLVGGMFLVTHKPSTTSTSTPAPAQTVDPAQRAQQKPGGTSDDSAQSQTGTRGKGLPVRVQRALDAHKVVVILFWNRKGVDDRSVKSSLDSLPKRKKVAVFADGVKHLSKYTRITAAANISTTPSLVVVNRKGQAEVIAGYLDRQTISQYIQNALRR
jgi:hypothetical protein